MLTPAALAGAPQASKLLGRQQAAALIAARLAALDHPADLLDEAAIAALIDHARGSQPRLRAALASTLFLASTEDAPSIGRALVLRALHDGERQPIPASLPGARSGWLWRIGGAALAGCVMALLYLLSGKPPMPPGTVAMTQAIQAASAIALQPGKLAGRPARTPLALTMPPPLMLQGPSASADDAAPRRPAGDTTPLDLPTAPAASVLLLYPAANPNAPRRLDEIVTHLRDAGVAHVTLQPVELGRARRPVSYFYADDLGVAEKVTSIVAETDWPGLASNSLAPRLVLPPAGLPARPPGTILIQLP